MREEFLFFYNFLTLEHTNIEELSMSIIIIIIIIVFVISTEKTCFVTRVPLISAPGERFGFNRIEDHHLIAT